MKIFHKDFNSKVIHLNFISESKNIMAVNRIVHQHELKICTRLSIA